MNTENIKVIVVDKNNTVSFLEVPKTHRVIVTGKEILSLDTYFKVHSTTSEFETEEKALEYYKTLKPKSIFNLRNMRYSKNKEVVEVFYFAVSPESDLDFIDYLFEDYENNIESKKVSIRNRSHII